MSLHDPSSFGRELSLYVVGINYLNDDASKSSRRFEAGLCAPGDLVELRREPKNKHDPYAVAIYSERGIQIGYLPADRAPWIGAKIAAGEEVIAIFQSIADHFAAIRVRFGGAAPTLPVQRPAPAPQDDFEADPEGPQWGA